VLRTQIHTHFFGSVFADTLTSNKKNYGHFLNSIFNQYLPGITQLFNKKVSSFMWCKTFGVGFTIFGFILSFTSWGPYFGKVHSLGLYPTLNFTKKIFLYPENIFKNMFLNVE